MHKGYLKSDGTSQSITHNKADATAMWIMDAEYYVKSQKKGTIEKIDKTLPDRVGRNYIITFDNKMKKGGMAKSEAPKGKSIVKKEKKTKEPKIVRGFFDDEPYEYNKGGEFGKPMKMYRVKVEGEGKNAKIYRENDEGKYVFSKESTEAYLKKKGYMAKGGKMNTSMGIAKMLYNKYDKTKRKEFLESAGYSSAVANDLSNEEWDSLEKAVHSNLARVLQSGKRKPIGAMAKGGMTEHGLKLGDKIVYDFDTDLDKKRGTGTPEVGVTDKKGELHYVDLDEGKRYEKGGYMAKGGMTNYGLVKNDVFIVTEPNHQSTGDMFTYIGTDEKGRIKAKSYPSKGKNPITISDLSSNGVRKITKEEATKVAKRKVLGNIANRMSGINYKAEGGYMKKGGKTDEKPKTPKGKKMKEKEPQIVRGYFDDEPYEYGGGGAIYVGDKVKIKGSNKTMVVKNISKGKKGYVEFSGDGGTFLKGDIEKYAEGGSISSWNYEIGGL